MARHIIRSEGGLERCDVARLNHLLHETPNGTRASRPRSNSSADAWPANGPDEPITVQGRGTVRRSA